MISVKIDTLYETNHCQSLEYHRSLYRVVDNYVGLRHFYQLLQSLAFLLTTSRHQILIIREHKLVDLSISTTKAIVEQLMNDFDRLYLLKNRAHQSISFSIEYVVKSQEYLELGLL